MARKRGLKNRNFHEAVSNALKEARLEGYPDDMITEAYKIAYLKYQEKPINRRCLFITALYNLYRERFGSLSMGTLHKQFRISDVTIRRYMRTVWV